MWTTVKLREKYRNGECFVVVPASISALVGTWHGVSSLWVAPDQPARQSESTALVGLAAQGRFTTIQYTWTDEGKSQDGLLMIGQEQKQGPVKAVWIDSWHMSDKIMLCEGAAQADGSIQVQGSYAVPPGPDWGWRISLLPETAKCSDCRCTTFPLIINKCWPLRLCTHATADCGDGNCEAGQSRGYPVDRKVSREALGREFSL